MNPCKNPQCRKPALSPTVAAAQGVPDGHCSLRCSVAVLALDADLHG